MVSLVAGPATVAAQEGAHKSGRGVTVALMKINIPDFDGGVIPVKYATLTCRLAVYRLPNGEMGRCLA